MTTRPQRAIGAPRFSARNAIAIYLREDGGEVERHRRYQPTRTPCPVFTNGNDYLTATASPKKRPKESRDYQWREVGRAAPGMEWTIWRAE